MFFFDDTLTTNYSPFGVMPCDLSFIFDRPIICKTGIYASQSDNSCWSIIGCDTYILSSFIADVPGDYMNHGMTPNGM